MTERTSDHARNRRAPGRPPTHEVVQHAATASSTAHGSSSAYKIHVLLYCCTRHTRRRRRRARRGGTREGARAALWRLALRHLQQPPQSGASGRGGGAKVGGWCRASRASTPPHRCAPRCQCAALSRRGPGQPMIPARAMLTAAAWIAAVPLPVAVAAAAAQPNFIILFAVRPHLSSDISRWL